MASMMEYVIAEVLEGAVNNVKEYNDTHKGELKTIKPRNFFKGIEEDEELDDLFKDVHFKQDQCGQRHREILPELQQKGKKQKADADDDE
mmetsp:Transcript_28969/g.63717  ORF Transcript_28969/g.63717 Transcript_28969/m.63717 type:complete len:90 (-) Transcript_28969:106-375(-)|eukprot:CAMPEP_0116897100 /NCGR_PEP_ID=MMETSP0467-20121206/6185_1 /TAXON_ID=283647 /ORGANISM="Mesodinium pulex, Strain SPMC105" /LENGTH=89 /DNA_ID=CAMNT_0004568615 /DNA_START=195 /DNA_END=464 /DNA_ORIENTATION=+